MVGEKRSMMGEWGTAVERGSRKDGDGEGEMAMDSRVPDTFLCGAGAPARHHGGVRGCVSPRVQGQGWDWTHFSLSRAVL